MHISRLELRNLGPIESVVIEPRMIEGRPVPVVIVGQNGAGKSLVLSSILDAFFEMRRASFQSLPEVSATNYVRVSSKNYVRAGAPYSHARVKLADDTGEITFDEVVSRIEWADLQAQFPALLQIPSLAAGEFPTSGFFKQVRIGDTSKAIVRGLPMLYRLGISSKGERLISVIVKRASQAAEVTVAHDLRLLSSGEAMCLAMSAEIIRSFELLSGAAPASLNVTRGIVLIDEIDLHLHIDFQRKVLPQLVRLFPSVQFIVSTHSPFFLLGMAETGDVDIYNLPIGNKIVASECKEFQIGYETFVAENQRFKDRFDQLSVAVASAGKPLLITEGKTDWQHLKLALGVLQGGGQFVDLDVDFLEFGDELDMGDTKLKQMCEHFASVPQARTMIFVFDRDNAKIVADMSGGEAGYRKLSDRVYSFCIPKPPHRENYEKVSIEFYYTDEEICSVDPATNRRLWFTNEVRGERDLTTGAMTFRALAAPIVASEFQKSVYDKDATGIVDEAGNSVGMSKAAFVATILGNPDIGPGIGRGPFAAIFEVVSSILGNSGAGH